MTEPTPAAPTAPDETATPEGPPTTGTTAPATGLVPSDRLEGALDPDVSAEPAELAVDAADGSALVIGEALIDVVRLPDGTVREHPGGSPANVALGLSRLGRQVDLLTWFGDDVRGHRLREHLERAGVAVVPGSDSAERTSVAAATVDADGVASYEFDLSWHVPARWASPATVPVVVHTGSIAAVLEPGGQDVARILSAHRDSATITYDPNLRPSLMPPAEVTRPVVENLVGVSDVVKVSDEDLSWLEPDTHPLDVARRWAAAGPAVVVVTRGDDGATAITSDGREIDVAAPRVEVADTVGAGDSFMGGLIDGLWGAGLVGGTARGALHGIDEPVLRGVLTRCAQIAAITVSRPGANPPTSAELEELG